MQTAADQLAGLEWSPEVSKPNFHTDYIAHETGRPETRDMLAQLGIRITDHGQRNVLLLDRNFEKLPGTVQIGFGGSDNIFAIGAKTALSGHFHCQANTVAVIGGHQHALSLNVMLYRGGKLFWGQGSRTYGCRMWIDGGKSLVVGDDCMFSEAIQIRTSDHHSIIDLDRYEQINFPADVTIGRHVWIGPNVSILKGVKIGSGAIIAAAALVSGEVPARELWGGVPAKHMRSRVSWVDSHPAMPPAIENLRHKIESGEW